MITDQDFYDCQIANFGRTWDWCEYFDEDKPGYHGCSLIRGFIANDFGDDDARCIMQQLVADYLGLGAP